LEGLALLIRGWCRPLPGVRCRELDAMLGEAGLLRIREVRRMPARRTRVWCLGDREWRERYDEREGRQRGGHESDDTRRASLVDGLVAEHRPPWVETPTLRTLSKTT
jgi:hypothetical protein